MRRDEFDSLVYWLPLVALLVNIAFDILEGVPGLNSFGSFVDKNEYIPQVTAFVLFPVFFFSSRSRTPASAITFYLAMLASSLDIFSPELFKIFGFGESIELRFGVVGLALLLLNVGLSRAWKPGSASG